MQRILEAKNIFKSYTLATKRYIEASKKIDIKECKVIENEIRCPTEEAIFKLKIITSIVVFFTQFFQPNKKTIMGMVAKAAIRKDNEGDEFQSANQSHVSLDTLIISLL